METDRTYRSDSITLAQRKAALGKAPAYMYLFAWESPAEDGKLLAHHALEITFVFDNTSTVPAISGGGPQAAALADKMSDAWIAFARTGEPTMHSCQAGRCIRLRRVQPWFSTTNARSSMTRALTKGACGQPCDTRGEH